MIMRNLGAVITELIPVVPKELGDRLKYLVEEKIPYSPPESMDLCWREAQYELSRYLPATPDKLNEWQKKALKIWTQKDW